MKRRRAHRARVLIAVTALAALVCSAAAAEESFDYFRNSWNVIGLKDYERGTRVTPDNQLLLADNKTVRLRFGRALAPLSRAQTKDRRSIVVVHRHERASIQDEGDQAQVAPLRPSSCSARASSSSVKAPCSFSQSSRNSARASARSFAAAASASQDEMPFRALRAASRTRSPSSASSEMLILSTFIR